MIKDKKIIAVIPVRKNSQDIKNKNLIKIGKYSLLERTILIAKKSKFIDDVIVSTDCKKMFQISKKYKVNQKNLRPKKLATSKALTIDVIKDIILKKKNTKLIYSFIASFITYQNIKNDQSIFKQIQSK